MFVRMHTDAPEIKINLFDQILRTYAASVTKTQGHPKKMKAGIFLFLQDAHWQFLRLNPGYLCSAMRVYQPTLQQHSRL